MRSRVRDREGVRGLGALVEWLALVSIYEIEVTLFYQNILSTNTEY